MNNYYYLDLTLTVPTEDYPIPLDAFQEHIIRSLKSLFGEFGACINVDILKYNPQTHRGIIRVPSKYYVKLRSSLTLSGNCFNDICVYRIHKASPLLLALQGDSRDYIH